MRGALVVLAMAVAVVVVGAAFYYISASRPPFIPHNLVDQTPYGGILAVAASAYHPGEAIAFTLRNNGTLDLKALNCAVSVEHLGGGTWKRVNPGCPGAGAVLHAGQAWASTWRATLSDGSPPPAGSYRGRLEVTQGDLTRTLIVGFELS